MNIFSIAELKNILNKFFHLKKWLQILILTIPTSIFHVAFLNKPMIGEMHDFRQAQTSLLTRSFVEGGVHLSSPLAVFGIHTNLPMEFPLFQVISAGISSLFGINSSESTRLLSIIFFQITCLLIFEITNRWFDKRAAYISVLFFQVTPFALIWGHAALIEWMPVAFVLSSLLLLDSWFESRQRSIRSLSYLIFGGIFLALGFLIKITTGVAMAPIIFLTLASKSFSGPKNNREKTVRVVYVFIFLLISILIAEFWTKYSDKIKQANKFTIFLTSSSQQSRIFGTLHQRLSINTWTHIFDFWGAILGGTSIIFILFLAIYLFKDKQLNILVILVSIFFGPILFTNLYYIHNYYSIVIYPFIIILGSIMISKFATELNFGSTFVRSSLLVLILFLGSSLSSSGRENLFVLFHADRKTVQLSEISQNVPEKTGILYLNCDWSPVWPYETKRPALMIPNNVGESINWKLEKDDLDSIHYAFNCEKKYSHAAEQNLRSLLPLGYKFTNVSGDLYLISSDTQRKLN